MFMRLPTARKRLAALAAAVCVGCAAHAQAGDAALVGAITANTVTLNSQLKATNTLQAATLAENIAIQGFLSDIYDYEKVMYDYMSKAQDAVTSVYGIVRCAQLGEDIVSTLNDCRREAQDHPQGLLVSLMVNDVWTDTLSESAALVAYVTTIVKSGGSKNLLNSAERIRVLNTVNNRLSNLSASLHRLKRQIRLMDWADLARDLAPREFYKALDTKASYDATVRDIQRLIDNI